MTEAGMTIRERLENNRLLGVGVAGALLLVAAIVVAIQFWPQKKPDLSLQYYSDDDGQTWFSAPVTNVAPFDHDGKTAVIAQVFTYDGGSKRYCAYLAKFTPDAKKKLESAIAEAKSNGQNVNNVSLLHDPFFMRGNTLVKLPGPGNPWIPYLDPNANKVFSLHSPDGSAVDEAFVY